VVVGGKFAPWQEMGIDKVLTAMGVALHSSDPDAAARAQLLTEAVLEHRAAAVAKNALVRPEPQP